MKEWFKTLGVVTTMFIFWLFFFKALALIMIFLDEKFGYDLGFVIFFSVAILIVTTIITLCRKILK